MSVFTRRIKKSLKKNLLFILALSFCLVWIFWISVDPKVSANFRHKVLRKIEQQFASNENTKSENNLSATANNAQTNHSQNQNHDSIMTVANMNSGIVNDLVNAHSQNNRENINPNTNITISEQAESVKLIGISELRKPSTKINSPVSGKIEQIFVTLNREVRKGERLFKISDEVAKANYRILEIDYQAAKTEASQLADNLAKMQKEQTNLAINNTANSTTNLGNTENEVNPSANNPSNRNNYEQLKSSYNQALSKERQLKTRLDTAKMLLEQYEIVSPINGQILMINVNPGEFVREGSGQKPILTIGNQKEMAVRLIVNANDLYKIKSTTDVKASPKGAPQISVPLKFMRVEPNISSKNKDCLLKADANSNQKNAELLYSFENPEQNFLIGQEMEITINFSPAKKSN